jgi:hypothetical protein
MPVDYLDDGDEEAFALADDASASSEEDYDDNGGADDADSADDSPADSGADLHGAFDGTHSHGKYGKHSHDGDGDHSDAPLKASKQMSEKRGSGPRTLAEFRTAYAEHARQLAELREAKYLTDVRATMAAFDQTFKFSESSAPMLDPKTGKTLSERDAKVTPSRRLRTRYERFLLSDEARNLSDTARAEVLELVKLAYQHGAVPLTSMALSETETQPKRTVAAPGARRQAETGADAVALAEGKALQRFQKPLAALDNAERAIILAEAAAEAGYGGAER